MPGWRSTGVLGVQSSEGVLGQCRLAQQGCYGPGVRVVRVVYGWYGWYGGAGVARPGCDRGMACQLEVAQQNRVRTQVWVV